MCLLLVWAFLTLLSSSCVFSAELQGVGTEASPDVQLLFPGGFVSAVWSWCWAPEAGQKVDGLRDQGDSLQELIQAQFFHHLFLFPAGHSRLQVEQNLHKQAGCALPLCILDILEAVGNSFSAFIKFVTSPGSSFLPHWKVFAAFLGMQNLKYQSEFFKYEMEVLDFRCWLFISWAWSLWLIRTSLFLCVVLSGQAAESEGIGFIRTRPRCQELPLDCWAVD